MRTHRSFRMHVSSSRLLSRLILFKITLVVHAVFLKTTLLPEISGWFKELRSKVEFKVCFTFPINLLFVRPTYVRLMNIRTTDRCRIKKEHVWKPCVLHTGVHLCTFVAFDILQESSLQL